jgi:hypothetical protein
VADDDGAPFTPSGVLWLELPSGLVVGTDFVGPGQEQGAVGRALTHALEQPFIGRPRRPDRVRVADPALVHEVRAALGPQPPILVAPTPELDEPRDDLWDAFYAEDEEPSYLADGRIPRGLVAHLLRCAAHLHHVAPWSVVGSEQLLRLDIPAFDVDGACVSINGSTGTATGILIFPSPAAFETFTERVQQPPVIGKPTSFGTEVLGLFARREDGPPNVTVACADGSSRLPEVRDLRIAAACASALAAFFETHWRFLEAGEGRPLRGTYPSDGPFGVEVTIGMPYEAGDLGA